MTSPIPRSSITPRPKSPRRGRLSTLLAGLALVLASGVGADTPAELPGEIRFVASNLISTANGTFHSWKIVNAEVDPSDLTRGFVEVEIDIASVDTGIERRDDHLRTADFFEIERWPTATVRAHSPKAMGQDEQGNARYAAQFDLRIRDVAKTVEGEFRILGRDPLRVEGSLEIDRMDFGVGEPKTWNPMSITQRVPIRFSATLR